MIKNIIHPEEEEEETIEEKYLKGAYKNFSLHYKDARKAIEKDINNIKNCKTKEYERDFIWLFFLGIIPFKKPASWQKILNEQRAKYLQLRNKYFSKDIEDFMVLKRVEDTYKYDGYTATV